MHGQGVPPRHWLITGVSSGLGLALARAALARGDVVAGTVRSEEARQQFAALAPGRSLARVLDVTDHAAIQHTVADIEAATGPIDVLVNNAGYALVGGVEEASAAEIRKQFEVNVFGAVAVMQAVLPFMRRRRRGRIVNISSVSGLVGWPSLGIYSGSKFALEGISETLAQEVAELGIKVILIEPGGLRTDFSGRSAHPAQLSLADYDSTVGACKRILAEHAGHEQGDPRKAAEAILTVVDSPSPPLRLLLGSDAARYAVGKLEEQQKQISEWEALTHSIGFT